MRKKFEDFDDLRDEVDHEIKIYEYEHYHLVKIGKAMFIITDDKFDIKLNLIGFSEDFQAVERPNGQSREIEQENRCYSYGSRDEMPLYVFKAIAQYFNYDLADDLNYFLKHDKNKINFR